MTFVVLIYPVLITICGKTRYGGGQSRKIYVLRQWKLWHSSLLLMWKCLSMSGTSLATQMCDPGDRAMAGAFLPLTPSVGTYRRKQE